MDSPFQKLFRYSKVVLSTDFRSLAVFRMGIGCLVMIDALLRLRDLTFHYSDLGVISIAVARASLEQRVPGAWSLAFLHGSPWWCGILLGILALSGIGLAIGWRSKWLTLICWLLIVSIHYRNPFVLNGGDTLLRLLLFWSLWLPLGRVWSVDAHRKGEKTFHGEVNVSPLILQICLMYWCSAIFKTHPVWREHGTALDHVAHLGSYTFSWAEHLWRYPGLTKSLTFITLWLEQAGPALLFVSFWRGPIRTLLATAFISFHLGIAALMNIGLFPFVCAVAWLGLLPGEFWQWINSQFRFPHQRRVVSSYWNQPRKGAWLRIWHGTLYGTMALSLLINFISLNPERYAWMFHPSLRFTSNVLHLKQKWRLFANRPTTRDGWFVTEAVFEDGRTGDLLNQGDPVSWARPPSIRKTFANTRWRKLWLNSFHHRNPSVINGLHQWLLRDWERRNGRKIVSLKIFFVLEDYLHPEDNEQRITIFPIERLDSSHKAIFAGDNRRNQEIERLNPFTGIE